MSNLLVNENWPNNRKFTKKQKLTFNDFYDFANTDAMTIKLFLQFSGQFVFLKKNHCMYF